MKKYCCILFIILLASCRKYVEIDQIGVRTLKYTTDYRSLMNDNTVLEYTYGFPLLSGDDVEFTDVTRINQLTEIWKNVYTWQAKYMSESQGDQDWERLYKIIYNCNEVINGVLSSLNGKEAEKQQIYGEALVHRANAYLLLVNIYARQYDAATAATDLGVPLLLTPDLFVKLNRASVKTVYDQVTGDLIAAAEWLPALPDYNTRPAKVSAYALLSRAFLNMRDFNKAGSYADSALKLQNTLLDLKTYVGNTAAIPQRLADPEIMLSKLVTGQYTAIPLSTSLLQLLGTSDLRYTLFTNAGSAFPGSFSAAFTGRAYWRYKYTTTESNAIFTGPSVPEMMLIKAECVARASDAGTAVDLLNKLRIKRFTTADYQPLTAVDAADALAKVVNERKRELFGRGFRWFDQKRLNKDAAFAASVTRTLNNVTYTLDPGSNRYMYPIGDKYILLNPELEQNPR